MEVVSKTELVRNMPFQKFYVTRAGRGGGGSSLMLPLVVVGQSKSGLKPSAQYVHYPLLYLSYRLGYQPKLRLSQLTLIQLKGQLPKLHLFPLHSRNPSQANHLHL